MKTIISVVGRVDLPFRCHPGLRVFADTLDVYRDKKLLIAAGNVYVHHGPRARSTPTGSSSTSRTAPPRSITPAAS